MLSSERIRFDASELGVESEVDRWTSARFQVRCGGSISCQRGLMGPHPQLLTWTDAPWIKCHKPAVCGAPFTSIV